MKIGKISPKRNFYLYIAVGICFILAGILFCPLWQKTDLPWADWGSRIIQLLIAALLFLYLFGYLLKKLMQKKGGVIGLIAILEFSCLLLIALGCVLSQFRVINISGACAIFGLCLWCRGTTEIFRAYYYQRGSSPRYPVYWLCLAIAMVSFGMYCIARPLFSDVVILWIFVVLLFALGILLTSYGALCRPHRK